MRHSENENKDIIQAKMKMAFQESQNLVSQSKRSKMASEDSKILMMKEMNITANQMIFSLVYKDSYMLAISSL